MLRCPTCRFITPTGPLRRLLHLPPCGPHFPPTIALALLVEGLGPALSLKRHGAGKQAWFLDSLCRREGLDALLSAIGAHEEQLHAVNVTFPSPQAQQLASRRQFMFDAERFLNTTIPHNILPGIPFSVADVCDLPIVEQSGTAAAERAASIVLEAGRIWRNELRSARNMKALTKIQVLAQQFKREQTKARIYNHSYLTVLENIQITQIHRPSQPSSDKNS